MHASQYSSLLALCPVTSATVECHWRLAVNNHNLSTVMKKRLPGALDGRGACALPQPCRPLSAIQRKTCYVRDFSLDSCSTPSVALAQPWGSASPASLEQLYRTVRTATKGTFRSLPPTGQASLGSIWLPSSDAYRPSRAANPRWPFH